MIDRQSGGIAFLIQRNQKRFCEKEQFLNKNKDKEIKQSMRTLSIALVLLLTVTATLATEHEELHSILSDAVNFQFCFLL